MKHKRERTTDRVIFSISRNTLLILFGIIILFFILFTEDLSAKMVGFWGSILGGIIGGIFTYVGVLLGIKDQRYKDYTSELPKKIINLDNLLKIGSEFGDLGYELFSLKHDIEFVIEESKFSKSLSTFFKKNPHGLVEIYDLVEEYKKQIIYLGDRFYPLAIEVDIETYKTFREKIDMISNHYGYILFQINYNIEGKLGDFNIISSFNEAKKNEDEALKELYIFLENKKSYYEDQVANII